MITKRILATSIVVLVMLVPMLGMAQSAAPTREMYLAVAKQGWVFDLRSSLLRRDPDLPPVIFDARDPSTAAVCVFGQVAHPQSRDVLVQMERLLVRIFDRKSLFTYAGDALADCPRRQRVYLRLYGGAGPSVALNEDLRALDQEFGFDLPRGRREHIRSPAQGIGFFGRRGNVAHLLVRQPDTETPSDLERDFFRSILIEELFQTFSFGVDILKFDPSTPFLSKLQENPARLNRLDWGSEDYMQRLLNSNPVGLCAFDFFMLHALAKMPMDNSNSDAFLSYLADQFDQLLRETKETLSDPVFEVLLDRSCQAMPETSPQLKALKN